MLDIVTIPVTPFGQNARIVGCGETKECVIVDPGGDSDVVLAALTRSGYSCKAVWLTHAHLDHCGGVQPILDALGVELVGHPGEEPMRANVRRIAGMYGLSPDDWFDCPEPTRMISGGEVLTVGRHEADVLFTPGHSPGHVSFYFKADGVLLSGDALFEGSIGRTDLPGGNHEELLRSIRERILTLPDDTRVLSGHGPDTTVGRERRSNPFLV